MRKWFIKIEDGIGNQMFIYAHARELQEKYGGEIIMDTHAITSKQWISLPHLFLNEHVRVANAWDKFELYPLMFLNKIQNKFFKSKNLKQYRFWGKLGLLNQYKLPYYESLVKPIFRSGYVIGSWKSDRFFADVQEILREEFKVKEPITEKNKTVIDELQSCESVCLHIRLGDYLDEEWRSKLYICDNDYYNDAINEIKKHVPNPVFYVFAPTHKDFEMIKSDFKFDAPVKLLDLGNTDYEDLQLMYACKHYIMSNSTYSWWAQYMGEDPNKVVVAPSLFNNVKAWNTDDIFQSNWKIVQLNIKEKQH